MFKGQCKKGCEEDKAYGRLIPKLVYYVLQLQIVIPREMRKSYSYKAVHRDGYNLTNIDTDTNDCLLRSELTIFLSILL